MMSFFDELKRRKVFRVGAAYLLVFWLLLQVTDVVVPILELPAWVAKLVLFLLVAGFPVALLLAWAFELTPAGLKKEKDIDRTAIAVTDPGKNLAGRRAFGVAAGLLVIGIAAAIFLRVPPQPEDMEASTVAAAPRSLAVLPFDNRSGDSSQDYFSDGMTDQLTTTLSRIAALKVIARNSAASYKGSEKGATQIGSELGVEALVTGSVMRAGGRVRISAELVAADTETILWADSYERDESDVLALQGDVARAIADAIELRLSPDESARLAESRKVDPNAFEEYLRGRALWKLRTESAVREARDHFQKAIRIAPDFALGYAGLADSYIILGVHGFEPPREAMAAAQAAAEYALELDPNAGEPHASLGDILFHYQWDWKGSEKALKRAMELAPGFATAFQWSSEPLLLTGNINQAITNLHRARELDPLAMIHRATLGMALAMAGKSDEAIAELKAALAIDPRNPSVRIQLTRQLLANGRIDDAVAEARHLVAANPGHVRGRSLLGLCLAMAGQTQEALGILQRLNDEGRDNFVSPLDRARITAGLRDHDATLRYLEQAVTAREGALPWLATHKEFDFLHGDPRFTAIIDEIGIPRQRTDSTD